MLPPGKHSASILLIFLACALSSSCFVGGFPGGNPGGDTTIELSNRKISQQDVMDDFYGPSNSQKNAASFYKEQWQAHSSDRSASLPKSTSVTWLTIAGCLIENDPNNYQDYYKFIISRIGDKDKRVASAAVYALRAAHGPDAIDLMVSEISKERDFVSPDATTAIDHFIKTTYYSAQNRADFSYAVSRMSQLCKSKEPPNVRGLREVCEDVYRLSKG